MQNHVLLFQAGISNDYGQKRRCQGTASGCARDDNRQTKPDRATTSSRAQLLQEAHKKL